MKKTLLLIIISLGLKLSASAGDLDSLKQQLQYNLSDTTKAGLYLKMAQAYLDLKAPNRVFKSRNSENAVNYSMLALHLYSKLEDTTGLKNSYASLGKSYHANRKFTQAKWFMIQSTILAKGQKDITGMVAALVELAKIKMENGEYPTAKKDLNYAMKLSTKYNIVDFQTDIAQGIALADNGIKNMPEIEEVKEAASGNSTIIIDAPAVKSVKLKAGLKNKYKAKTVKVNTIAAKKTKPVAAESLASL